MRRPILLLSLALLASASYADQDLVKRGAAITVKVPSYTEAQTALMALVRRAGGTAADELRASTQTGRHSGWWRVRVPKQNLDSFLADVRSLGAVYGEKLSLEDMSEQYVDLGHRAERLGEHQKRLESVLGSSRKLRGGDILFIQERIFRTSVDRDMLLQRREAIAGKADASSVIVDVFEPAPVKIEPHGALAKTKAAFADAVRGIALSAIGSIGSLLTLLLYVVVGLVVWLFFKRPITATWKRVLRFFDSSATSSPAVEPVKAPEPPQPT